MDPISLGAGAGAGGLLVWLFRFLFEREVKKADAEQERLRDRVHSLANEQQNLAIALTKATAVVQACEAAHERIAAAERELVAFKLHVAQYYVSGEWLKDEVGRLTAQVGRLEDKFDKFAGSRRPRAPA